MTITFYITPNKVQHNIWHLDHQHTLRERPYQVVWRQFTVELLAGIRATRVLRVKGFTQKKNIFWSSHVDIHIKMGWWFILQWWKVPPFNPAQCYFKLTFFPMHFYSTRLLKVYSSSSSESSLQANASHICQYSYFNLSAPQTPAEPLKSLSKVPFGFLRDQAQVATLTIWGFGSLVAASLCYKYIMALLWQEAEPALADVGTWVMWEAVRRY